MNAISPYIFAGPPGGSNFFGGSPLASELSSPWGADALELSFLELAPLLQALEGQGSSGSPSSPQFPNSFPGSCDSGFGGSPPGLPGSFPGSCDSGFGGSPPGLPGSFPGSCDSGFGGTPLGFPVSFPGSHNCCGCCDDTSSPAGSPAPGPDMMPSVQWQGNQPSSSSHTYTTNVAPNGNVDQNVTFSNATGSQLSNIHNDYNASTGVENSVETAANGHHAYVQTTVQGNSDISTVSGDADVTGGATKFVVTMNGDQEDCTEYFADGHTQHWIDTSNSGQTMNPWSHVSSGVTNDSETSVSTGNGWQASYSPDSGADYTATYV
ncbi:MAG: hypothetical protein ACYCW6_13930 [Candidatus Xenobia bacterium]